MGPQIGPELFLDQSCAPKTTPERWGQKFKQSHGGLVLTENHFCVFGLQIRNLGQTIFGNLGLPNKESWANDFGESGPSK